MRWPLTAARGLWSARFGPGRAAALTTAAAVGALPPSGRGRAAGPPDRPCHLLRRRVAHPDPGGSHGHRPVDSGDDPSYLATKARKPILDGTTAVREGQVIVTWSTLSTIARHPRAVAPPTPVGDVLDGRRDGRRVEVQGTLREVQMAQGAAARRPGRGRLAAVIWVRSGSVSDAAGLVGQAVRARGVPLRATPPRVTGASPSCSSSTSATYCS